MPQVKGGPLTVRAPHETINVGSMLTNRSKFTSVGIKSTNVSKNALPSTFSRTGAKQKHLQNPSNHDELQEFNLLGIFKYKRETSPTEDKIKKTAMILNNDRSFDKYFTDMKKRNIAKGFQTM